MTSKRLYFTEALTAIVPVALMTWHVVWMANTFINITPKIRVRNDQVYHFRSLNVTGPVENLINR